ncbi:MAG: hypothetical protein JXR38_05760 [Bacilli bacterium]|nr:hypothetical protein [Bacilli bacterium]
MINYRGITINPGVASGKVHKLVKLTDDTYKAAEKIDQIAVLEAALAKSTKMLDEQIATANMLYSDSISIIFEAHKLMANDPLVVDRAKELIRQGHNAYDSYQAAADEVIEKFVVMENEYLRNRIIDIEDAIDRVLAAIEDTVYEIQLDFSDPRILVVEKIKPSLVLNIEKSAIAGIISESGSYNQHSGTILRTRDIPTLIIDNCTRLFNDQDKVLLDASEGVAYINPEPNFINDFYRERG